LIVQNNLILGTYSKNSSTYLLWGQITHPQLVGNVDNEDLKHNDVDCAMQEATWLIITNCTNQI
jgi:hypothetical protein